MGKSGLTDPAESTRRHDNDWLTVLATLTIFFFHCARFFDIEGWHVKNNQLDQSLSLFVAVVCQWVMPLFFFLSGISSYYSLKSRHIGAYLGNRFRRLMIPLTFGVFVLLAPVQVWIERVGHGRFQGGFLEFYPHYFDGFYAFGGNFAWMGLHLWYLEILFLFTIITIPLFVLVQKHGQGRGDKGRLSIFTNRAGIYLLGLPLFAVEWLVNHYPEGVGMRAFGGWSVLSYLVIFIIGYITSFGKRFTEAVVKYRYISSLLALTTTSLMFFIPIDLTGLGENVKYTLIAFTRSFNSWFWLVAILGLGHWRLNFNNSLLGYAREAALPFYVLHQTVIVVIGYYIAHWTLPVPVKYILLGAASFTSIMVIYEFAIKRTKVLRFLFGMKARRSLGPIPSADGLSPAK